MMTSWIRQMLPEEATCDIVPLELLPLFEVRAKSLRP